MATRTSTKSVPTTRTIEQIIREAPVQAKVMAALLSAMIVEGSGLTKLADRLMNEFETEIEAACTDPETDEGTEAMLDELMRLRSASMR